MTMNVLARMRDQGEFEQVIALNDRACLSRGLHGAARHLARAGLGGDPDLSLRNRGSGAHRRFPSRPGDDVQGRRRRSPRRWRQDRPHGIGLARPRKGPQGRGTRNREFDSSAAESVRVPRFSRRSERKRRRSSGVPERRECPRKRSWKRRPSPGSALPGGGGAGSFDRRRRRSYNFRLPTTAFAIPDPLAISDNGGQWVLPSKQEVEWLRK